MSSEFKDRNQSLLALLLQRLLLDLEEDESLAPIVGVSQQVPPLTKKAQERARQRVMKSFRDRTAQLELERLTSLKRAASVRSPGQDEADDAGASGERLHYFDGAWWAAASEELAADSPLTARQQAISELVADGLTNAEIAALLHVSRATVKGHITVALRRLGLRDRTQLAIHVRRTAQLASHRASREASALDSTVSSDRVRYLTDSPAPLLARPEPRLLDRLTDRQREVVILVAQGLRTEEIAQRLFLSPATVKSHLTASMRRLDVHTRTQLAVLVNNGD